MSVIQFSHETMEQIKVPVVIDGDFAITLLKIIHFATDNTDDEGFDNLLFCNHSMPKLEKFVEELSAGIDIENKKEK